MSATYGRTVAAGPTGARKTDEGAVRVVPRRKSGPNYRLRRYAVEALTMVVGLVIAIWSITPIYNMWMIALDSHDDVFAGAIWPEHPSLQSFVIVVTQGFWYLANFWHQFGNSFYVGLTTMFLTLLIGSLASFTVGRLRLRNGWMLTNAALMTYVIPASFLAIPFYRIMQIYGLTNNLWSVIAALTTFATPYAIFIFSQYGKSIPMELDESARIDARRSENSAESATGIIPGDRGKDGGSWCRHPLQCRESGFWQALSPVPLAGVMTGPVT